MQKTILLITVILLLIPSMGIMEESQRLSTPIKIPEPEIQVEILEETSLKLSVDRISFYNPVYWQTDGDPHISSCGPNVENQIALSRDLFFDENGYKHLCGARVTIITDDGNVFENYVVWDTMNPRFTNTVDIMLPHTDHTEAFNLGVTSGVLYIH